MSDREALLGLAEALNSAPRTLRRDECGDWRINGKVGHIYGVPGGFLLYAVASSPMAWTYAKRALSFAKLTNDGDTEGMFALVRLPSPTEAKTIRSYLGIPKRRVLSDAELERLRSIGVQGRSASPLFAKKLALADCPAA